MKRQRNSADDDVGWDAGADAAHGNVTWVSEARALNGPCADQEDKGMSQERVEEAGSGDRQDPDDLRIVLRIPRACYDEATKGVDTECTECVEGWLNHAANILDEVATLCYQKIDPRSLKEHPNHEMRDWHESIIYDLKRAPCDMSPIITTARFAEWCVEMGCPEDIEDRRLARHVTSVFRSILLEPEDSVAQAAMDALTPSDLARVARYSIDFFNEVGG